jgi:hypothetical protein
MAESPLPAPRLEATLQVAEERLPDVLRRSLDFGCRPVVTKHDDGTVTLPVIATASQLEELREAGYDVQLIETPGGIDYGIGQGDRFDGGRTAPRGFGEKTGR